LMFGLQVALLMAAFNWKKAEEQVVSAEVQS